MISPAVIPAKAGTQHNKNAALRHYFFQVWAPAYAGVTEHSNV
jgi:hypothetical protein